MVYIFTAMYCEAHAFIDFFHLKKDTSQTRFQVFYNEKEQILLTVTGTGMLAASVAVSSICTAYGAKGEDFLVNVIKFLIRQPIRRFIQMLCTVIRF